MQEPPRERDTLDLLFWQVSGLGVGGMTAVAGAALLLASGAGWQAGLVCILSPALAVLGSIAGMLWGMRGKRP